jgi:hypothetical protein
MSLPPPNVTRTVVQRFARCQLRYQHELASRPLVLPTAEFFPDAYESDELSAKLLVARLQELAGLSDVPISASLVSGSASQAPAACSSGSCAVPQSGPQQISRLVDRAEGWVMQVPREELDHPIALTTNLVRSMAYIFLVETQLDGEVIEPPVDITADIVAVALGFGPLLLQGSYLYAKSCGGPRVASLTKLTVHEVAVATALFARVHSANVKKTYPLLEITQREALKAAVDLIASNPSIDKSFKNPKTLEATSLGRFELNERKSFLSRLWSGKKLSKAEYELDALDPSLALEDLEALMLDMPPSSRAGRQHSLDPGKAEETDVVTPTVSEKTDDLSALVAESIQESKKSSDLRQRRD